MRYEDEQHILTFDAYDAEGASRLIVIAVETEDGHTYVRGTAKRDATGIPESAYPRWWFGAKSFNNVRAEALREAREVAEEHGLTIQDPDVVGVGKAPASAAPRY